MGTNLDAYKNLSFKGKADNESNEIKAGLRKADIDDEKLRNIFDAIDKADASGQKDGVLDENEVKMFKDKVINFAKHGKNSVFSEREAEKMLKDLGIKDANVKASDLFNLINKFTEKSKNIKKQELVQVEQNGKKENALKTEYNNRTETVLPDGSKIVVVNKKDKQGNPVKVTAQFNKDGKVQKEVIEGKYNTVTKSYKYENDKIKQVDVESKDKNGNLLEKSTKTNTYNDLGQLIATETNKENSKKIKTTILENFEYNNQGKVAKKKETKRGPKAFLINGKKVPAQTKSETTFEYDSQGKLIKTKKIEGALKDSTIVEYDTNGKIKHQEQTKTRLRILKKDGKTAFSESKATSTIDYTYDENGNKTSCDIKTTDDYGKPSTTSIKYEADGKTIKTKDREYYQRGAKVVEHYEGSNIANRAGLPSERIEYEEDGKTIKRRTVNEFDSDGILISRKVYDKNNKLVASHDFSNVNGEFEVSNQVARGDCYLLAALNSLSQTEDGHNILKQNLKVDTDAKTGKKTYTISFPGAKELKQKLLNGTAANGLKALPNDKIYIQDSYTITEDELKTAAKKAGSKYSAGDKDILLMEVAYEKFRKDVYKTRMENKISNKITAPGFGTFSNQYLQKGDFLSGGLPSDAAYLITGKNSQTYDNDRNYKEIPTLYVDSDYQMHLTDNNGNIIDKSTYAKDTIDPKMQAILDELEKDSQDGKIDNFAACAAFKVSSQEVNGQVISGGGHALTITKVDKDNVYLANPWYPEQEIVMSRKDFAKSCFRLDSTPLNKKGEEIIQENPVITQNDTNNNNNNVVSNKPNYTVPKGKGYTAMIKEALIAQGIKVTPGNIQKAKEQFEQANPKGTVKIYEGKNQQWKGNSYLIANTEVYIPQFVIE